MKKLLILFTILFSTAAVANDTNTQTNSSEVIQILQGGIQLQTIIHINLVRQMTQPAQLQTILQTPQPHQKYPHHPLIHHLIHQ